MDALLSREDFKRLVLAASAGRCVLCLKPASAAHHIMERKLFSDGGYRLSNGAAVCDECHWRCETTEISVEQVLCARGLESPLLPEGLSVHKSYDKWGNEVLPDGRRLPGPLFEDPGVQKALRKGRVLWRFNSYG